MLRRRNSRTLNVPPPASNPAAPRLRLRVTTAAESILRGGHPWLFADSVREQNRAGLLGELAVIFDRKDRFLAVGLFDPDSPIRVRLLHSGKPQAINREWWLARFARALAVRADLLDEHTTGCRLINGESDGWPGLVLDRYDTTLKAVKLYTAARAAPACGRRSPNCSPTKPPAKATCSGNQSQSA